MIPWRFKAVYPLDPRGRRLARLGSELALLHWRADLDNRISTVRTASFIYSDREGKKNHRMVTLYGVEVEYSFLFFKKSEKWINLEFDMPLAPGIDMVLNVPWQGDYVWDVLHRLKEDVERELQEG
jgi:hypothetical protein